MIVTSIENCSRYASLHPQLDKAFSWIRSTDLDSVPTGRLELDGSTLYCMVSDYISKAPEQAGWESHRKYIDIQIVRAGKECIDTADLLTLKEKAAYDEGRDFLELEGEAQQSVLLNAGQLVVLFPEDAHRPGIHSDRKNASPVSKIVIKVLL